MVDVHTNVTILLGLMFALVGVVMSCAVTITLVLVGVYKYITCNMHTVCNTITSKLYPVSLRTKIAM